jgi:hypothetical protein
MAHGKREMLVGGELLEDLKNGVTGTGKGRREAGPFLQSPQELQHPPSPGTFSNHFRSLEADISFFGSETIRKLSLVNCDY